MSGEKKRYNGDRCIIICIILYAFNSVFINIFYFTTDNFFLFLITPLFLLLSLYSRSKKNLYENYVLV